ncbi:hypothetical protein CXG81DRAFT_27819 [Caulochytrium protostelioides]|uniref:Prefoldin beta-like protein n=1 Tax=Caulochytrium protostelioides TaxID=1555241 RepID=A0A4P9X341_9FUNG|nr:Prefoldin beta-like protein [Caulochytrium protostelioides]RKO99426.1 hypothetical protein CXG81DRAFT_27819 [Caulochytrium protostelioides]|eukprot:RKO99426.1 hypothetical protein CXG81DRAFT_27819 [Caulochytrium protostelioides]
MSSAAAAAQPSNQQLLATFQAMKQELNGIASKIGELEMDRDEHQLVIDTISGMSGDRKCFRLVGGILVERTVKDVLPLVKGNQQGINTTLQQLLATYKKKEEAMVAFQKESGVKISQV